MDGADLGKVKVEAVVAEHLKGEKIRVFKVPAEEALSKRRMGHRSLLTRLEIKKINGPSAAKTAAGEDRSRPQKEPAKTEEKED